MLNNEAGGVVRAINPDGSPMITLAGYPEDRAYWRPACSDDKELLKSLRVGDYVIGQVGTGRVFHAFHIVEAGSREMFEKRLKELEDAMAALEKPRFCAVIQREGAIRPPRFYIVTMSDQGAVISGVVHLTRVYPDEADREGDPK